jgi:hypothetical protein
MTQEIIEMARQAGAASGKPTPDAPEIVFTQCLDIYRFAKLIAAKEREACLNCYSPDDTASDWSDKIRARGQE